jgi:copper(I)-binding protein
MTTVRARAPRCAMRWLASLVVAAAGIAAAMPVAAEVHLTTPWMRPAAAGSDARAYVDIASDEPVTLVGASSPMARNVEIRVVKDTDGVDPGKPVKSLAVVPGTPTRLAYKGNHLLLRGLKTAVANATPVPVVLTFRDAKGRRVTAETKLQVRGIVAPPGG